MRLLLIRHGKAGDSEAWIEAGKDDDKRPLTRNGAAQMKQAARGLTRIVKRIDVLATSPLLRAVQTAKIVYKAYDDAPQFMELDLLAGDHSVAELVQWIKAHDLDNGTIAFVGHSPDMNLWAAAFISGRAKEGIIDVKKGGVVIIDFAMSVALGKGTLCGLYTSRDLRKIE